MKEQIINYVLNSMQNILQGNDLQQLENILYVAMINCDIIPKQNDIMLVDNSWKNELNDFLLNKKISGCSEKTIKKYEEHLFKLLSYFNKPICEIEESDIYNYMNSYKNIRQISNRSLENMRLVFSSFFNWAQKHRRITYNPMLVIGKIKVEYRIKKPYSDEEMELLSYGCESLRDYAMVEFLYSSCVRVSELMQLNIEDIKFNEHELIVYGKGGKERTVYINGKTTLHLKRYLNSRSDNNPALFVSQRKPYQRLSISGIESAIKRIGTRALVNNVYPHRFRRTGATNALNRGMPIQEVSQFLGHVNISTTQLYSIVNQRSIKLSHEKYLSA